MSLRSFGIGFGIGAGVSVLFGAPLVPALAYGFIAGSLSALFTSMGGPRVVVAQQPAVVVEPWYTRMGFSYTNPRPRRTVVVHDNTSSFGWSRPSTWFANTSWFAPSAPRTPGSTTTIHHASNSAPVAVTTTPTQAGGTIISSAPSVPSRAHNVHASTTLFGGGSMPTPVPVPSSPVSMVSTGGSSSILGATPVVPPTARDVRQTTLFSAPQAPAPSQPSLLSSLGSLLSAPSVVPPHAQNVRVTTTTSAAPIARTNTPSGTFLAENPHAPRPQVGASTTNASGTFLATNPHAPRPTSGSVINTPVTLPNGAQVTKVQRKLLF